MGSLLLTNHHYSSQNVTDICVHVGPVIVGFGARTMTVAEDAKTIQVEVTLQQVSNVTVAVDIIITNGTAVEQQG